MIFPVLQLNEKPKDSFKSSVQLIRRFERLKFLSNLPTTPISKDKMISEVECILLYKLINHSFTNNNSGIASLVMEDFKDNFRLLTMLSPSVSFIPYSHYYSKLSLKFMHKFFSLLSHASSRIRLSCMSPCQTKIVIDNGINLMSIDLITGEYSLLEASSEDIRNITWSEDGLRLMKLIGNIVTIYDMTIKKNIFIFSSLANEFLYCALSFDGKKIIICDTDRSPTIINVDNNQELRQLSSCCALKAIWSQDGTLIALLDLDIVTYNMMIYNAFSYLLLYEFPIEANHIERDSCALSLHPTNAFIALACDDKVEIWDLRTVKKINEFTTKENINALYADRGQFFSWHPTKPWLAFLSINLTKNFLSNGNHQEVYPLLSSTMLIWDFMKKETVFSCYNMVPATSIFWDKNGNNLYLNLSKQILKLNFSSHLSLIDNLKKIPLDQALLLKAIIQYHLQGNKKYRMDAASKNILKKFPKELQLSVCSLIEERNWIHPVPGYKKVNRVLLSYF